MQSFYERLWCRYMELYILLYSLYYLNPMLKNVIHPSKLLNVASSSWDHVYFHFSLTSTPFLAEWVLFFCIILSCKSRPLRRYFLISISWNSSFLVQSKREGKRKKVSSHNNCFSLVKSKKKKIASTSKFFFFSSFFPTLQNPTFYKENWESSFTKALVLQ